MKKRALLVYPAHPPHTFWSFKYALKFVRKSSTFPPLGLLTVGALLPQDWELRLVDLNIEPLRERDLRWADLVMVSAMAVQRSSAESVIKKAKALGKPVVAGGPLFTMHFDEFKDSVDHQVLGEAEINLPKFLQDLERGKAERIYFPPGFADIKKTPVPRFDLVKIYRYASMNIQFSRGCPYNCEFCDIPLLYGHKPRTKNAPQLIKELEALYQLGWRGGVFFVDDNFIGNRKNLKAEILPALIQWSRFRDYPFRFFTEASINLADDEELMEMMVEAGFDEVFIGIETPNPESLKEVHKVQNYRRDLFGAIEKIHSHGLIVQGGFILGFDSDPPNIFDTMVEFIQKSGIITAMVGLLQAPRGTKLYRKLKEQGRLLKEFVDNNTDFSLNFIPKMDYRKLLLGYKKVVDKLYSPEGLYQRINAFIETYRPVTKAKYRLTRERLWAFIRSIFVIGIFDQGRKYYWKSLLKTAFKKPKLFPLTVTFEIYGYHFRKIYRAQAKKIKELLSVRQERFSR